MIIAVKAVQLSERRAAAQLAERVFLASLAKACAWGDFNDATNIELAAEAAAAEVAYRFA
jgi:hypothetical protein